MERLFVWLGGAAFVGSLASAAWTYLVRFGAMQPFAGWRPAAIDALLLTGFALHHSLFARARAKRALARLVPEHLLRSCYVWVASLLLLTVCAAWQPIGGLVYQAAGAAVWLLAGIQIAGVLLIARSVRAIDALELAGIRPGRGQTPLQTTGPYSLIRHPLYFGWVLLVFASASMTGDRLAFALLTTGYVALAVPWEEQSLVQEFGADYERYREQVRWRILPFVY